MKYNLGNLVKVDERHIFIDRKGMQGRTQIFTKSCAVTYISEYYPFGLQNQQTSRTQFGSKEQRYKYNGKELMKDFNLEQEDFGARLYNPQIARWSVADMMAEKYSSYSPYSYVLGNPIRLIDPDGNEPKEPIGPGYYTASVNQKTIGFSIRHPGIAVEIGIYLRGRSNISTNAVRFSTNIGLSENSRREGSQVNAFRHVLWQSTITKQFGSDIAMQVGNAHEENSFAASGSNLQTLFPNLGKADETIDLLNNSIGRAIGSANPNDNMQQLALKTLDYFLNVGLWTATPIKGKTGNIIGYSIAQSKISISTYNNAKKIIQGFNDKGRTPQQQKASEIAEEERREARQDDYKQRME